MKRSRLAEVVAPDPKGSLMWEAVVPIITNPFTLLELIHMSLVGAGIGLVIMASGLWIIGGGIQPGDVSILFMAAGVFLTAIVGSFTAIALLFFGNRYFALYHCTPGGIYFQGTRGHDESGTKFTFGAKPLLVDGAVSSKKRWEKDLPWGKVDHFTDFPSMRSIQLKRGRWHMMRLYTPDTETHDRVVAYFSARVRQERP